MADAENNDKNKVFSELKKLSPAERIEKLKELEEKRKQEIKKAQDMIKDSVDEIREEQDLLEQIEGEERLQREELEGKKQDQQDLEEMVEGGHEREEEARQAENSQYQIQLSMEPASSLYDKIKNVYRGVQEAGEMTAEQREQIENLSYAVQHKKQAIDSGEYSTSVSQIEDLMSASKSILNYMRKGE